MKKEKASRIFVSAFCLVLAGFLAVFLVTPKLSFSEKEKKVLSVMPKLTLQSFTDGSFFSGVDSFVSDHFPLREMWIGAAAYGNLLAGRNGVNGVYQGKNGYLIGVPFLKNRAQIVKNQMFVSKFCDSLGLKVYLMPVPSAGYVLEEQLSGMHMDYWDDQVYSSLIQALGVQAELIDLRNPLKEAAARIQVFYKTDHHWTSAGAFAAYQAFLAQVFPGSSVNQGDYEKEIIDGFYGTSYAKSGLWLNRPDVIELWHSPLSKNVMVEITDDDIGITRSGDSMFERSYTEQSDKYPVFLGGNHSLVKLSNPDASTNQKILLIKDSFANSFAPFLTQQYSEVYLVDLRYSRQRSVSELAEQNGIETILFLYSTDDWTNDNNFMWLK